MSTRQEKLTALRDAYDRLGVAVGVLLLTDDVPPPPPPPPPSGLAEVIANFPSDIVEGTPDLLIPTPGGPLDGRGIGASPAVEPGPRPFDAARFASYTRVTPSTLKAARALGARLLLEPGEYPSFGLLQPNIWIAGLPGAVVHSSPGTEFGLLINGASGCRVEHLTFRGVQHDDGHQTIFIKDSSNCLIADCDIGNDGTGRPKEGVQIGESNDNTSGNIVEHCNVTGTMDGVSCYGKTGHKIRHNRIWGCLTDAIELDKSTGDISVVGNRVWAAGTSYLSFQSAGPGPYHITDNQFCGQGATTTYSGVDHFTEPIKHRGNTPTVHLSRNTIVAQRQGKYCNQFFGAGGSTRGNVFIQFREPLWGFAGGYGPVPQTDMDRNGYWIGDPIPSEPWAIYNAPGMVTWSQLQASGREENGILLRGPA